MLVLGRALKVLKISSQHFLLVQPALGELSPNPAYHVKSYQGVLTFFLNHIISATLSEQQKISLKARLCLLDLDLFNGLGRLTQS